MFGFVDLVTLAATVHTLEDRLDQEVSLDRDWDQVTPLVLGVIGNFREDTVGSPKEPRDLPRTLIPIRKEYFMEKNILSRCYV